MHVSREDGLACSWQPRSAASSPVRVATLLNGIQEAAGSAEAGRSLGRALQSSDDISISSASELSTAAKTDCGEASESWLNSALRVTGSYRAIAVAFLRVSRANTHAPRSACVHAARVIKEHFTIYLCGIEHHLRLILVVQCTRAAPSGVAICSCAALTFVSSRAQHCPRFPVYYLPMILACIFSINQLCTRDMQG